MIRTFFWLPTVTNVGHASLSVDMKDEACVYISWWPANNLNVLKKASGTIHSLEDDEECEGKAADVSVEVETGLNELAICEWWQKFRKKDFEYGLGGRNCSWVVIQALRAGGSDAFFPWYKIGIKKNIPAKSVIMPVIVPLVQMILTHNLLVGTSLITSALKTFTEGLRKSMEERPLRPNSSIKLAVVAAVDEFSSIWSPVDVLAYCSVLSVNARRSADGQSLLGRRD